VQEGDIIQPGDRVGIVEAMKMMNEIEAEIGGRVARILVKNGQAVEYGQPLMLIEPL
jgi:acetyl-CoA carboxylase biotin carboxyl carrier protein